MSDRIEMIMMFGLAAVSMYGIAEAIMRYF